MKIGDIKRGDLVICDLEPVRGSEQGGRRPVLVVPNDISNSSSPTLIAVPLTSKIQTRKHVTNVFVSKHDSGLGRDSTILCNQVRTVDKSRVLEKLCNIESHIVQKVDEALKISLDLS